MIILICLINVVIETIVTTFVTFAQDADVGQKTVWWSSEVLIERVDAETLKEGMTVTLINWGNVIVTNITRYVLPVMSLV